MKPEELERIRELKRKHEREWLAHDGVVAVGVGTVASGATGLIVSVKENAEAIRTVIPEMIDGIEIEIRVSGELRAL